MSKTIRVGILTEVHTLDPQRAQDTDSLFVLRQIFDSPFAHRDGASDLEPVLFDGPLRAEAPGVDGGRQVFRGRVRAGVCFSDGTPLGASELAEALGRIAVVRDQAAVHFEGDDVVFTLEQPNARFDLVLSHPQCSIFRRDGDQFLGTGPYRLAEDSRPDRVRLVRNPFSSVEARIDEILFVAHPPDAEGHASALVDAIQAGEVDLSIVLARDEIDRLTGVRKTIRPGMSTSILYFNTDSPQLGDGRIRRALARSIDRLEMTRVSYKNALAFAASGLLPRSLGSADDDLAYDPAEVQGELAAGLSLPTKLRVLMPWGPRMYLPHPDRFFEVLQSQLGRVGVELEPVSTESSLDFNQRIIAGREDLVLIGWVADTTDAADFLEANLASSRVPCRENISVASNNGRLRSAAMDEALLRYRADPSTSGLDEIMSVLSEEAPLVPLAYGPSTAVSAYRVQGFKPSPLSIFPIARVDLEG